jgi:hypothetical protein
MPRGSKPGERRGGRQKGTPNKASAAARAVALAFLDRRSDEEIDALWQASKGESATKALAMWLGAMEFVLPKLARNEVSGPDGGPVRVIKVDLGD